MKRRRFVQIGLTAAAAALGRTTPAIAGPAMHEVAFDQAWLQAHARELARAAPRAPLRLTALGALDWDRYQAIRFRPERALWAGRGLPFDIQFCHPGMRYLEPVTIHEVVDGRASAIPYAADRFDLAAAGLDPARLPAGIGYAGWRLHLRGEPTRDRMVFLGASYFRAVGASLQYGLSARGLAIDCGLARPEEFPRFSAFWIERPAIDAEVLIVHALLESESLTGAYRFTIRPGEPLIVDVAATLYPRRAIERLGLAPLTSMFLTARHDRRVADDWRPAIHDSDGLALCTGEGERLWRPLVNPPRPQVGTYAGTAPRGFGLLQRDRDFDHYQDDGAFYERRPSLWVEPLTGFGDGALHLLELPAAHETIDNIAAFWSPTRSPAPGQALTIAYRLYWGERMPFASPAARVAATWTGIGGAVGGERPYASRRFIVDFAGGALADAHGTSIETIVSASAGRVESVSTRPLEAIGGVRATFDLVPPADAASIELRAFLLRGTHVLSETWSYRWSPPQAGTGG